MKKSNYYQRLGVKRTASTDEIKLAYRKLIRRYHPDRSCLDKNHLDQGFLGTGDDERIVLINQAYETLKNPTTRAAYDSQLMWQKTATNLGKVGRTLDKFKDNVLDNVEVLKQNAKKALSKDNAYDDHHRVSLYPWQAMLGDKVVIQTAYHRLQVFVPAFCEGVTLKITGAGKPDGQGGFGDLYVQCVIVMPKQLPNDNQKQAWLQLKQSYQTSVH